MEDEGADGGKKKLPNDDPEEQQEQQQSNNTGSKQQKACQTQQQQQQQQSSWRLIKPSSAAAANQVRIPSLASKSLSSQVMEYYQKYSQNSNLNQYFSLPASTSNTTADGAKYYYCELTPNYVPGSQGCIGQDYNLKSYIPKERRRWVRPPLIGESSSGEGSSVYMKQSMTESQSPRSDSTQDAAATGHDNNNETRHQHQSQQSSTISTEALIITEEKTSDNPEVTTSERKTSTSPTSSVASHKPLEWDSGADVGYLYAASSSSTNGALSAQRFQQLSTLERMALARGCSAALRLDPEGTTGQQQSPGSSTTTSAVRTTVTATVLSLTTTQRTQNTQSGASSNGRPGASSTPLFGNASGSESEIEITPIVKNHLPGIIAGDEVDSGLPENNKFKRELMKVAKDIDETPKSSSSTVFKQPHHLKYPADDSNSRSKPPVSIPGSSNSSEADNRQRRRRRSLVTPTSSPSRKQQSDGTTEDEAGAAAESQQGPLKKSSSMNLLASPTSKFPLKRSQSELNLLGLTDKVAAQRLIFNSSSSIATVVNNHHPLHHFHKPITCDKFIQTSMRTCDQESVGIQVSVLKDEEKPPLPKRATSLAPRFANSILKTSKSTYKVPHPKTPCARGKSKQVEEDQNEKDTDSSLESSQNASLTPHAEDTENNATGRANSFEYFPGHIYENVPNGSSSRVSSVDTGRSNSTTMPNTSSSIDEKLWGDSDSLVRDLERSVSILKSLVDANKLDKQVKRRLIHHVVKRLCSAKYTDDDKIEHNLDENVPWNPDDARNKVYRAEILQALAKNTTDSSDDWRKPVREREPKKKSSKKPASASEARNVKEIIDMPPAIESSNSDKFDRNTDRTVMDGRKARMGLRTDDCNRRSSSNTTPTNKSESSECFLPQRTYNSNKNEKIKDMFVTSTSNSSPQDQNRALLDAVNNRRAVVPLDSSNEAGNSAADWRLPATASERRFEIRQRNTSASDSADSKLVTYAEMEKRNQLIWITNEISHLSNLKKLLEREPKSSKAERTSKSSPRKSKPPINSKPPKPLPSTSTHHQQQHRHQQQQLQNGDDSQLSRQWSSHCNLASSSGNNVGNVRRLKKRNSCTQTGSDSSFAYSRSGSEIVSAKIQGPNTKLTSVCVQTLRNVGCCPVHATPASHLACTCSSEPACPYCRSKNHPPPSPRSRNKHACNESSEDASKETKNHLNAKKLRCTCEIGSEASKPALEMPKRTAVGVGAQTCDNQQQQQQQHYCEDSTCSCTRYRLTGSSETSQSQKDCDCDNGKQQQQQLLVRSFERMQIDHQRTTQVRKLFDKASGTSDHLCRQCKKSEEAQTSARSECSYPSNGIKKSVSQPYFLASGIPPVGREADQPNSHRDFCCGTKPKDRDRSSSSPKPSSSTNSSMLTDCKVCRVCGTVYQNKRNCRCVAKSFPKAVAYELSFVNDGRADVEINSIEKSVEARGDGSRRECDCRAGRPRRFGHRKRHTLQEYLVANNPTFADNVEIRRQYVSEIQRMRELRRERKVQLLAMATTTNIFTSPRLNKDKKFVPQKRIPDSEMKARLRKRYFQLPEVRAKRLQQQLQKETRCNKLMAKIFGKKLQQKALNGETDLSQSVSVISNL